MPTFAAETLHGFTQAILHAAGTPADEARIMADCLIRANLSGHDSHGVMRIPQYCAGIRQGGVVPGAAIERVRSGPSTAMFDGHWAFGQVSMYRALEEGFERVKESELFAFGIDHCNHIGRLGHFTEMAAERGFASILTVNVIGPGAAVAPFGGREAKYGTNPISFGFPTEGDPVIVDMTPSVAAEGKIRLVRNKGGKLPEGWVLDSEGNPSTDPNAFYGPPRGAIMPLGGPLGHKGFGLAMLVELLSGTLTGVGNVGEDKRGGQGVFCLLMNPEAFRPLEETRSAASWLVDYMKDCPPAAGFDEVLVPGEPESRARRARAKDGCMVDDRTWGDIVAEAKRYGCVVPTD